MHGNVIGLVALDLVLWLIHAGMAGMPLVLRLARVNLDDPSADDSGFGIPANVIADFEHLAHAVHHYRCTGCAFTEFVRA